MPSEPGLVQRWLTRARTAWLDVRFGGFTGGVKKSPFGHLGANETVSTRLDLIDALLGPRMRPGEVFVDVGCGKGRVLNWAIRDGRAARVIGLEIDREVAEGAAARLTRHAHCEVRIGDACALLPADATLIYMWSPFNRAVMVAFRDALFQRTDASHRKQHLRIIYNNALHLDVWQEDARCNVAPLVVPVTAEHEAALITFAG
jgi:SAM-dependent methyltransferase